MAFNYWGKIALLLGLILLLKSPRLLAQANSRQAIGSLQTRGTVSVEGSPATSGVSLYPGDTVRTGADGSGNVNMPDRGTLVIGANTEITFLPGQPGERFASLHQGSIALHLHGRAPASSIELGKFVLTGESYVEIEAEVERSPDGSAHIRCLGGSVGVVELEGVQSIFLHREEEAEISSDGRMRRVVAAAPSQSTSPASSSRPTPSVAGKSHAGLITLGLGGGVAAAVAALEITHQRQTVSPAAP